MNHQPYENWILDEVQLTPTEKESLEDHLKVCSECHQLDSSWSKIQSKLQSIPAKPAPAGFMHRWKTDFAARKVAQERRQARTLFISLSSGAAAIMIALAVILLPDLSVISLLVGFLTTIVKLFSGLESLFTIVSHFVSNASTTTLIISGLLIAGWISLAAFAWAVSIWRITTKGVKTK